MFQRIRQALFVGMVGLIFAAPSVAEEAPRFRFVKGETLTYRITQTTKTSETVVDEKTEKASVNEHSSKVELVRKWKVVDLDDKGIATLEMTIASMKWEQKLPSGDTVDFDSTKPDDLNKKEMAKLVGPTLAILRIDPQGKLIEVKDSKVGPASRFVTELPFKITLPDETPKAGDTWNRTYIIQLDPPQGTGEKYEATQKYSNQEPKNGFVTVGVSTSIKDLPNQAADQIPLLPMMSEGIVFFHAATGRYYGARMRIEKELTNHQGDGSKYKFTTTYVEDFQQDK